MTTDRATTVQPATDDELIELECKLVVYYLKRGEQTYADQARDRIEYWVLRKHHKRP